MKGVKSEIMEDSILGQKTKDLKYKMKMVRGEHLINAGFGGDGSVWQTLNRIIIPSYLKQKKFMTGMFFAGFSVSFVSFSNPVLLFSVCLE